MKILIVCSGNAENFDFSINQAFVYEQIEAIKQNFWIEYDTFFIKGRGVLGYIKNFKQFKIKIKEFKPDLVHAHFGLSGLFACLQKSIPVIVTFHGSDVNNFCSRILSKIAASLSKFNIFVNKKMINRIGNYSKSAIVPCGINLEKFYPVNKTAARVQLQFKLDKYYILFSSRFDNKIKNYSLAKASLDKLGANIELLELKNKKREEVNLLLNACDVLLLTSLSEGSPQIIKEAMACNCPIVSTDVGDIREIIDNTEGCFITSFEPEDVSSKIEKALEFSRTEGRTKGREKIKHLDNKIIAEKIYEIYKMVLNENL